MNSRIVLIEDDRAFRETLVDLLHERPHPVVAFGEGRSALDWLLAGHDADVVLSDLQMPGQSGLEVCRAVREARPNLPVVLMTAFGDMDGVIAALRAGAYDFLPKPFEEETLRWALNRALDASRAQRRLRDLEGQLERLTPREAPHGASPAMVELRDLIERVAAAQLTALIRGETGTGKELVARALHRRSARSQGPFVALNCASVPETLLESELFGHRRGAFTGADASRRGLLEQARGGCLFLDEIGDMPPQLQVKLLRVLQERRARPVGGDEEVEVDVWILAATHQDLRAAVEEGRFREDLLYRLNVVELELPPLRARQEDVLLLAQQAIEAAAERQGRTPPRMSQAFSAALLDYTWPGNVRELENAMERAVALSRHVTLEPTDLPVAVRQHRPRPEEPVELISLAEVERRHMDRVLAAVHGNKARAAQILGIGRKTLYRKLDRSDPAESN